MHFVETGLAGLLILLSGLQPIALNLKQTLVSSNWLALDSDTPSLSDRVLFLAGRRGSVLANT